MGTKPYRPSAKTVRVLVVEDNPVARAGIAALIDSEADLELCGEATCLGDAIQALHRMVPEVVLVDLGLPDGNGLELLSHVRQHYPTVCPLVVSSYETIVHVERARRAGAVDFIAKHELSERLVGAIRRALRG